MSSDSNKKKFTLIIHEGQNLTLSAQSALRRQLEKYSVNLRVIMLCETTSGLINAIKSRCLMIRIPSPSNEEIRNILISILD